MPRMGITETQILAALAALQDRGETISKLTVRRELGDTGSFSTISACLAKWRSAQLPATVHVPVDIPERVQGAFSTAWGLAMAASQAGLAKERESLRADYEAREKISSLALDEANEATKTLELENDSIKDKLADLTAKDEAAQLQITLQAERIGYLTAKIEEAMKAKEAAEAVHSNVKFLIWSGRKNSWWQTTGGYTKTRSEATAWTVADLPHLITIVDLGKHDVPRLHDVMVLINNGEPRTQTED